jgi:hypothetical protein
MARDGAAEHISTKPQAQATTMQKECEANIEPKAPLGCDHLRTRFAPGYRLCPWNQNFVAQNFVAIDPCCSEVINFDLLQARAQGSHDAVVMPRLQ